MEQRACRGRVVAVKPRVGLHRSFDQLWHSYRGYALVLEDGTRIAIGRAAHDKQALRIGDEVCIGFLVAPTTGGQSAKRQ